MAFVFVFVLNHEIYRLASCDFIRRISWAVFNDRWALVPILFLFNTSHECCSKSGVTISSEGSEKNKKMNEPSSSEHNDGLVICFICGIAISNASACDENKNQNSIGMNAECNVKRSVGCLKHFTKEMCAIHSPCDMWSWLKMCHGNGYLCQANKFHFSYPKKTKLNRNYGERERV